MSLQKAINVYANAPANKGARNGRKKAGLSSSKSLSSGSIAHMNSIDGGGSVSSFRSSTTFLHPTSNNPKYKLLEKFFDVQRLEHEAAKRIQQSWRRSRVLIPWRNAVHAMMAIVTIQRRARGMITRRFVAKWYHYRTMLTTVIQARIRRYLSNHHLRPLIRREYFLARSIQRIARGMIGRHRAQRILHDLAAGRIQSLWRGVVARIACDGLWLQHKVVLPIQNAARRMLAVRKCARLKNRLNYTALVIQRKYRCYRAALAVGRDLFDREMTYRMDTIAALTIEEEHCQERIRRQLDRAVKSRVKEEAVSAQKKVMQQEELIYRQENDLIELQRQLDILSPRAIEQGFREELLKNVHESRQRLTQSKLTHLFTFSLDSCRRDWNLEHQVEELEEYAAQRNRLSRSCTLEYDDRRHLNYEREITALRREKRRAVADERRAWQVLYYSKDGKPDKRRRPGRPWHPSVFAGAERSTYHCANINLLANTTTQPSSSSSSVLNQVQHTVEKVSLQSYLDEVKVYEQLLKPIEAVLQPALMRPRGYGHEQNQALAQAMTGLGLEGDDQQHQHHFSNSVTEELEAEQEAAFRSLSRRSRGRQLLKKSTGKSGSWLRRRLGLDTADSSSSTAPSSAGTAMAFEPLLPVDELEPGSVLLPDHSRESGPRVRFDLNNDDELQQQQWQHQQHQQQHDIPVATTAQKKKKSRLWKKSLQRYLPDENSYAETFADLFLKPVQPLPLIEAPKIIKKDEVVPVPQTQQKQQVVQVQAGDEGFMTVDDIRRQADRELSQKLHARQRERKKAQRRIGIIPWELLDEVDGERFHFQNEKSHAEFNMKY